MLLDRRTFAAGSAALLSGCATVGTRTAVGCTPLAPVLEQTRAMYKLGVQMGVVPREAGALSAELPETQW